VALRRADISIPAPALEAMKCREDRRDSNTREINNKVWLKLDCLQEFSTDLDFRGTWIDSRLKFPSDSDDPIYIPHQNIDKFWIPDLYFPNEKSGKTHEITIPNKSIRIYPNGTVRYLTR